MAKLTEQKLTYKVGTELSKVEIAKGGDIANIHDVLKEQGEPRIFQEEFFPIVRASELSLADKIFQYKPQTAKQENFRNRLIAVIESGISDFRAQSCHPLFSRKEQRIFYRKEYGMPAILSNIKWKKVAEEYCPSKKSRLGYEKERNAFLGVILKTLVTKKHYSLEEAWYVLCDNSESIARYRISYSYFPPIGGFSNLGNGYSITLSNKDDGTFVYFGGKPEDDGDYRPLTNTIATLPDEREC